MLGVSPDADSAQIVRAYRRRARAVHPDVSTEHDAGAQFSALWTAYQLLLETAHEPRQAPPGDDQGPVVDQDHRQRVAAPGPVGGWPAGWTSQGVAWLVAGPVRVQPPAGPTHQPGQRDWRTVGLRSRSRPAPDDATIRVEPGHE